MNCCSSDNSTNSHSDCAITKDLNNEINNNPRIKFQKISNNLKSDVDNNNEDDKGGSCRLPTVEKKENKDNVISGFKRTKTKHFK